MEEKENKTSDQVKNKITSDKENIKSKKAKLNNKSKNNFTKEDYLLKLSNLENERKRFERDKINFINFSNHKVLLELVDILDSFHMAMNSKNISPEIKNWLAGFKMINQQFDSLLTRNGVKPIITKVGDEFRPEIHNSIESVDSDLPENKIVQIIKKGYTHNDRLLRSSMVKTSKNKENNQKNKKEKE